MFSAEDLKKCWFLAGPTAGGKTATALRMCQRMDAEIVSMDSMAVYRKLDIGTAKPTAEEQAMAVHHLIDVVDPDHEFSVSDFVDQATLAVADILKRNKIPLFVGGTGLYLRSLLRGLFDGPEADWELRKELQRHADSFGNESLHEQLAEIDPASADRLHCNDRRRVIRAIEVFRVTGQPLSQLQNNAPLPESERPAAVFWIDPPRDWLHERINRRVDQMMTDGLLEETESLLAMQPPIGRTARQGLGYREVIAHIEDGIPLPDTVEAIKTGTRQFAKRQHTWFRSLEEVTSVVVTGQESPDELAVRLIDHRRRE